ncbi:phosphatidate cytidylyltransferase [Erysipelothrix tonsillarum]|uniref:phosphatidate cytidylyltransferase n=1 Tax=Erysipelothrix tonsillarum TaxID=38402 RepID=UPI0003624BE0|nr:phosphatidate cytidylyltransferase [Erysipelothrix tonsillarum]
MKERITTAIVLVAIFGAALLAGNKALFALITALILVGAYEIYLLNKDRLKPIIVPFIIAFTLTGGLIEPNYVPAFAAVLIMTLFAFTVFFEWYTFENVSYMFILIMMLVLAVQAVTVVLSFDKLVFIYVLLATYLTDTFAYFGGMLFGKHKLIERISPKKTIEGAVIGYLMSAILSFIFGYNFILDFVPLNAIIAGSLLIPFIGQIGDLAFSSIKRHFDVKDFGYIFPGHGGVLDRIDSVVFALLTFNIILTIFI